MHTAENIADNVLSVATKPAEGATACLYVQTLIYVRDLATAAMATGEVAAVNRSALKGKISHSSWGRGPQHLLERPKLGLFYSPCEPLPPALNQL